MDRLRQIIERNDTRMGRIFDYIIQFFIVISLISFSVETIQNLNYTIRELLRIVEIIAVIVFTIEYILRVFIAKRKLKFVFSFLGIIDLLAILPFYITSGIDLRTIRIFRFLRLFRMFKLIRYSRAIKRFYKAFLIAKEEIMLFFIIAIFVFFIAAVGIYYFEQNAQPQAFASIFHCFWWAVATLTTVGYGDVYPVTVGGKVFTFVILMLGLGLVAVPSGLVASALTEARRLEENK